MKARDNFQQAMESLIKAWSDDYTKNQKKDPENWPEPETWEECLSDFMIWFETEENE